MKIPPINQTIMEGQTVFFQCAPKWPDTSNVTWWKDGVMLTDLHDLVHRSIIGPDGSLTIDPTVMSDLGEYECVIHGDDDIKQSARAFLNIQCKLYYIFSLFYSLRFNLTRCKKHNRMMKLHQKLKHVIQFVSLQAHFYFYYYILPIIILLFFLRFKSVLYPKFFFFNDNYIYNKVKKNKTLSQNLYIIICI